MNEDIEELLRHLSLRRPGAELDRRILDRLAPRLRAAKVVAVASGLAAAAAAMILIALALHHPHIPLAPTSQAPPYDAADQQMLEGWHVPTEIDPAAAGPITMDVPSLTAPSSQGAPLTWNIPSLEFPSPEELVEDPEERSNNHDS